MYLFCVLFSLVENKKNTYSSKLFFLLIIYIFLLVIATLKPLGFGFDDLNYYTVISQQEREISNPYGWEPGFMLLIIASSWFEDYSFIALNIFVLTICFILNGYVFYKLSPLISIAFLWYFSHLFFYKEITQLRIAVAYSIVLFGFYFLYLEKNKKFLFLILLAYLFHVSSLISLIAYLFVKLKKKHILSFIIIAMIISELGLVDAIIIKLSHLFLNEASFNSYILDKSGFAKELNPLNPTTVKYIIFSIFFYYYSVKLKDRTFDFLLKIYMIAPLWIILFSSFGTLASRPATIFSIVECILISNFAYNCYKNSIITKILIVFLSITLLLLNIVVIKPVDMDLIY
ncbi:hypothetical protein GKR67_07570 [Providencia alcalifaciens]|uniref:Exopolysaccharide biosynthesis protein n=1 Tax=Providencia alcalifaciens TaxID=126385 RepID=A0A346CLD9_9GAMM|nr:exopolysaccharide biosynthesis protein [Providencia alcalifaciens]MTC34471.1 hypothetical protein [Providencia alcalifaciens]